MSRLAGPRGGDRLAGTRALVLLALRRDRIYLPVWILFLAVAAIGTGSSYKNLYATAESRRGVVQGLADTPATLALYGRVYADSVGGLTAWRLLGLLLAIVGLMGILTVVRHTRADEESGRGELVGAAVVGRHAALAAALIVAAGADAALAALVALGLIGAGFGATGSLAIALALAAAGLMFAAVAAVAAQVAEYARTAGALAASVLGAAYLVRAIGDAGPHRLSWLSPLGWCQQLRPFAGERWWVLALPVALTAALLALAVVLVGVRDIGSGLLPPRTGPPEAATSLRSPLALAWRLQRGPLAGWAFGLAVAGAALGSIADGIRKIIGDNPGVKDALAELGGSRSLVDAYLGTTMGVLGIVAAAYAVQATLRLRSEETSGRAEPLLATAVSRVGWALSHAAVAAAGVAVLMLAAGVPAAVAHALQTGDAGELGRVLAAALVQVPAAWVLAGVALALFGLAPRASAAAWGVVGACVLLGEVGPLLNLGAWALDLSPFTHVPKLPGGDLTAAPLWLAAIAAALAAAGLAGFRRRDVA